MLWNPKRMLCKRELTLQKPKLMLPKRELMLKHKLMLQKKPKLMLQEPVRKSNVPVEHWTLSSLVCTCLVISSCSGTDIIVFLLLGKEDSEQITFFLWTRNKIMILFSTFFLNPKSTTASAIVPHNYLFFSRTNCPSKSPNRDNSCWNPE